MTEAQMEIPPIPKEDMQSDRLVDRGKQLFANASRHFAASATGQGLFIAQECRKLELDPREIRDTLLADSEALNTLVTNANRVHEALGVAEKVKEEFGEFTEETMHDNIEAAFTMAHDASILTDEALVDGMNKYSDYHKVNRRGKKVREEMDYRNQIDIMIDDRKRQIAYEERIQRRREIHLAAGKSQRPLIRLVRKSGRHAGHTS